MEKRGKNTVRNGEFELLPIHIRQPVHSLDEKNIHTRNLRSNS